MLNTEVIKYANGKETIVIKETLAKGKKLLISEGYTQCPNPIFYQKENSIIHYNKSMKCWIVEGIEF